MKHTLRVLVVSILTLGVGQAATAIYTFEGLPLGMPTPFTDTDNGVSATFTGEGYSVGTTFFSTLSGQIVLDANGPGNMLTITFSQPISSIGFNFALNGPDTTTMFLNASLGAAPVGSTSVMGVIPPGFGFPEGLLSFGGASFNTVVLSTDAWDFAIDNVTVTTSGVPEPASVLFVSPALGLLVWWRRRGRR